MIANLYLDVDAYGSINGDDVLLQSKTFADRIRIGGGTPPPPPPPTPGCRASVPAGNWQGEYFTNKDLSGSPKMVRDDGTLKYRFYTD